MGRTLHTWATFFAWLRLLGLFVMFVMVFLTIVLTGGIGWFVFETDSKHFADIIGAPDPNSYDMQMILNAEGSGVMPIDPEPENPAGIYDDKSWFQPMCTGKCNIPSANVHSTNLRYSDPVDTNFNDVLGCSQNKNWETCTDIFPEKCKNMFGVVPKQWNKDRSRVYVSQNRTHLCVTGMNLASDPLASWKDCLVYDFVEVPTSLLSFTFYGNIAFLVILLLSFPVEYYFHKKFMFQNKLYIDKYTEENTRARHHIINVFYHVVVGVFGIMLGAATMDLQRRYSEEMEPKTIQKVTTENGISFDPYDDDRECFNSDVGMLVWNTALGSHKVEKGGPLDINNCNEYTLIYFISLIAFGLVYIISGVLIGCARASKESWKEERGYVYRPKAPLKLSETEALEKKIEELQKQLMRSVPRNGDLEEQYNENDNSFYLQDIKGRMSAKTQLVF